MIQYSCFKSVLILLIFNSCTEDDHLPFQNRGTLVSYMSLGQLTTQTIKSNVDELSVDNTAVFDVTYYKIVYRTELNGEQLNASGLVIIPDDIDSVYLVGYFHGTQLPIKLLDAYDAKNETPSNYDGGAENFREIRNMGLTWSSAGYTVFMPDYVGFGDTNDEEHPYMNYPAAFAANIDGLIAVKSMLADLALPYDNRLFLTGWSQGGGACLSAHRYIQEEYADEFDIIASSSLAGPYHFNRFVDNILDNSGSELNISNIFSWAFYSLNKYSTLQRPTDQLYAYPVYDQFSAIFPPSKKPSEIFNTFFLNRIIDGRDTAFRQVLDENTFSEGWTPEGKIFFHHGEADDVVYYFNSVDAQSSLNAAGGDVTLYSYPGGGHDTELDHYIAVTLEDFNTLK